jgi:hypothetical protein
MGKFKRKITYKDKRDPTKKVKNGEGEYSKIEFVKENIALETFYKVNSPKIMIIYSSNFKENSRLSLNLSNL